MKRVFAKASACDGGLAQLARAPALHAGGHRFDSDILHKKGVKQDQDSIGSLKWFESILIHKSDVQWNVR